VQTAKASHDTMPDRGDRSRFLVSNGQPVATARRGRTDVSEPGTVVEAERLFATAVEAARSFGGHDQRLARSLFHQAQSLSAQGKYTEASLCSRNPLRSTKRTLAPITTTSPSSWSTMPPHCESRAESTRPLQSKRAAGLIEHKFDRMNKK